MVAELWFLAVAPAAAVLLLLSCQRLERSLRGHAAQLERSAAWRAEVRWWQQANERLAQWQAAAEASIDGGAQAVRALHFGIAAIPFSVLEAIPVTRDTTRLVHGIHDFTANSVYSAIAAVNRLAGAGGRQWLSHRPTRSREDEPLE